MNLPVIARLTVGLLLVAFIGIGALALVNGSSDPTPVNPLIGSASSPSTSTLITATDPECGDQGRRLAIYLTTGQPPQLDAQFGRERMDALALPVDQRAVYVDQEADALITSCDQQSAHAAQQASASAAAIANQKAATEATAPCEAIGGTIVRSWGGAVTCYVKIVMHSGETQHVELKVDGSGIEPLDNPDAATKTDCTKGTWNTQLGICLPR